jgi:hypothetical protein
MPIHVKVHHRSRRVLVEIDDELDRRAVEQCLAAYDRGDISGWKEVAVAMRGVGGLDASGVELLLYLRERAREWRLTLFRCGASVASLLAEAGLSPRVEPVSAPAPPPAAELTRRL